jgi:small subunit ribosomal protein S1
VIDAYDVGDVVEGKVTKVVTFGAFVEIHAGVEGLVHISELAAHHVENPREVVNQGDTLSVRIIEVDGERRRLSLSLKRVADNEAEGEDGSDGGDGGEGNYTSSGDSTAVYSTGEHSDGAEQPEEAEAEVVEDDAPVDAVPAEEAQAIVEEAAAPVEEPEAVDEAEAVVDEAEAVVDEAEAVVDEAEAVVDEAEVEVEEVEVADDEPAVEAAPAE